MAKYAFNCIYSAGYTEEVEFPEGKTWEDVEHWWIKWGTLHILFRGDKRVWEKDISVNIIDLIDAKRPTAVCVHPIDNDTGIDLNTDLAEV